MSELKTEKSEVVMTESNFETVFSGKFFGVLRWPQLDNLWDVIKTEADSWYIYEVGGEVPVKTKTSEKVAHFIDEIDTLLRREHDEDYCGIVYANNLDKPTLIKIFDPSNLGTSCSIAEQGPLPAWIISKMKPVDLAAMMQQTAQQTASRKRWWQKIFS